MSAPVPDRGLLVILFLNLLVSAGGVVLAVVRLASQ